MLAYFTTALCPQARSPGIDNGLVASKLLFSPAALMSEPEWLIQGSEFITSGQRNYLGSGHVTKINMAQSAQPLTLIHDKVRRCLSIERSGLLDFASLLLFDLLLGHCNIIKEPLFYKKGK